MRKQLVVLLPIVMLVLMLGCSEQPETEQSKPEDKGKSLSAQTPAHDGKGSENAQSAEPVLATKRMPDEVKQLPGFWRRPDGGYIIRITDVAANHTLNAQYFNPNPVKVSQSSWTRVEDRIGVFIELTDRNYPGATYHLIYDSADDRLSGEYYQPLQKQTYDVYFERVTE